MINNKVEVLILRHPQEQDYKLGSAKLIINNLSNAKISTGLSWPNFEKALGRKVDPKKWLVLYLGSIKLESSQSLTLLDKKNFIVDNQEDLIKEIEGLVVLDGTWTQAKALWWRNPWLLKLQRGVIKPFQPSLYGKLRREPRKESVSTIEAVATALEALGEPISTSKALVKSFREMLELHRQELKR